MNINETRLRAEDRLIPPRRAEATRFVATLNNVLHRLIPPDPGESRWCEEQYGLSCLWVADDREPRRGGTFEEYRFTSGYMIYQPLSEPSEGRESFGWGAIRLQEKMYLVRPKSVQIARSEISFEEKENFVKVDSLGDGIEKTYPVRNWRFQRPEVWIAREKMSFFQEPAWLQVEGVTREDMAQMPVTMVVDASVRDLGPWLNGMEIAQEDRHYSGILQAAEGVRSLNPTAPLTQMVRPGLDVAPLLRRRGSVETQITTAQLGPHEKGEQLLAELANGVIDIPITTESISKHIGESYLEHPTTMKILSSLWPMTISFSATEILRQGWMHDHAKLREGFAASWGQAIEAIYRSLAMQIAIPPDLEGFYEGILNLGGGDIGPWGGQPSLFANPDMGPRVKVGGSYVEIGALPNLVGWANEKCSFAVAISKKFETPPAYFPEGISETVLSVRDLSGGTLASAMIPRKAHREQFFEEDETNQGFVGLHRLQKTTTRGRVPFPTKFGIRGVEIDLTTSDRGDWQGRRGFASATMEEATQDNLLVVQGMNPGGLAQDWIHRMWGTAGRVGCHAMQLGGRLTGIEVGPNIISQFRREGKYYSTRRLGKRASTDGLACGMNRSMRYGRVTVGGAIIAMETDAAPGSIEEQWVKLFNALSMEIHLDTEINFVVVGTARAIGHDQAGVGITEQVYDTPTLVKMRYQRGMECVSHLAGVHVDYSLDSYGVDRIFLNQWGRLVLETDHPILVPAVQGRMSTRQRRRIEVALLLKTVVRIGGKIPGSFISSLPDYLNLQSSGGSWNLMNPDPEAWWRGRNGWRVPNEQDKDRARKVILEAVSLGQRSRLPEYRDVTAQRLMGRQSLVYSKTENNEIERALPLPPAFSPNERDLVIRQLKSLWRERAPKWDDPPLYEPRRGMGRVLETFLGRDIPEQVFLTPRVAIREREEEGFITFDSEPTTLRDTADKIELTPNGAIWTVAITHPDLSEDELEQVMRMPGSLYGLGHMLPMLGPLAGQFSLDEGCNRRAILVELTIESDVIATRFLGERVIHIEKNLTPGRVTELSHRDPETNQHILGMQAAERALRLPSCHPIGSFIEDIYRRLWTRVSEATNKCLSRHWGVLYGTERINPMIREEGPKGELLREFNTFFVPVNGASPYGSFTAPLRRGTDLGNLLRQLVVTDLGERKLRMLSDRLERIESSYKRSTEVRVRGYFLRAGLFYDQDRARIVKTPESGRHGEVRELKLSYLINFNE
jgi:hypothetical protein